MKLNIFSGSRRIALVLGAAWTIGCIAYGAFSEPHVYLTYAVSGFGASPKRAESCLSRDAQKFTTYTAPWGEEVNITLCFIAGEADDGSYLIPYRRVVSPENPEAKRIYAARDQALKQGASSDAAKLTDFLLKMPVDASGPATVWMGGEYDPDVRRYIDGVADSFRLDPDGFTRWKEVKAERAWEQWKQAFMVLFGGLAAGWALTACIGWVARGFLGIPKGRDMRTEIE
jgi:hypothetical protein